MNTDRQTELKPGYRRFQKGEILGERTRHVITFKPNKVNPGEDIYIEIPKLKDSATLVPDKMFLVFDFKCTGGKSWFNNNLAKQLQNRLVVKFAGEVVYDNTGESLFTTYEDLWMDKDVRSNMIEDGIATENQRKVISKSDDAVADLFVDVYGTKQRIHLKKILSDHGLYAPHRMAYDLQYVITLPKADEIMKAQANETLGSYSLENIELEYETITNSDLADEIESDYNAGRSLSFKHVTLMKTTNWEKSVTLVNESINLPRKSLAGIVMLFTKKVPGGSEEYVFPNIENVKVDIEGIPNSIYSQGIIKRRLFEEAKRMFGQTPNALNAKDFFTGNMFALVIDLRTIESRELYGTGYKLLTTQSGVSLAITKKATTEDLRCHIFVVSDGILKVQGGGFRGVMY